MNDELKGIEDIKKRSILVNKGHKGNQKTNIVIKKMSV